ncbi:MAG: hypothetical protein ABSG82_01390 [Sedimentisphaerales bacterium]|jgi:hypothetical protein
MVRLCNDIDVLKYEPALFGELHLTNQVLAAGSGGVLAGTTFEAEGADFVSAGVEPGGVIYLRSADGLLDGAYEIVAVDSASQLCVSVLQGDSKANPIAPQAGSNISYRISTLRPQTAEVSLRLTEYLGIRPGRADSDLSAEDILDTEAIRQMCVYGVIAAVYAMLAGGQGGEQFRDKELHYEQLFEKEKERCRVTIDADGDGVADRVRFGGCGRLVRD